MEGKPTEPIVSNYPRKINRGYEPLPIHTDIDAAIADCQVLFSIGSFSGIFLFLLIAVVPGGVVAAPFAYLIAVAGAAKFTRGPVNALGTILEWTSGRTRRFYAHIVLFVPLGFGLFAVRYAERQILASEAVEDVE